MNNILYIVVALISVVGSNWIVGLWKVRKRRNALRKMFNTKVRLVENPDKSPEAGKFILEEYVDNGEDKL